VDNPVGTGFSYAEGGDRSLMVRKDAEAAHDLVALLCARTPRGRRTQARSSSGQWSKVEEGKGRICEKKNV
jgi:hypothetical protein